MGGVLEPVSQSSLSFVTSCHSWFLQILESATLNVLIAELSLKLSFVHQLRIEMEESELQV